MSPEQLAELLIGIAKAQAAILEGVAKTVDKTPISPVKQAAQANVHAILGGQHKKPITFETLPAKLLEAALAPGSHAYRELDRTALEEVSRLLR